MTAIASVYLMMLLYNHPPVFVPMPDRATCETLRRDVMEVVRKREPGLRTVDQAVACVGR